MRHHRPEIWRPGPAHFYQQIEADFAGDGRALAAGARRPCHNYDGRFASRK